MSRTLHIGGELPRYTVEVDKSQLRLFAKATGETRAAYLDETAAQRAGYRSIPALPTFAFTLSMNPNDPFDMLSALDVDLSWILHGDQSFEFHAPICAGDSVRVERRLVDEFEKKGGALVFYAIEASLFNAGTGALLAQARQTIVVRKPVEGQS